MRKQFAAPLLFILAMIPPAFAQPLRIGYSNSPPMTFQRRGAPAGFAVEVLDAAASRARVQLRWEFFDGTVEEALGSGRVDIWPAAADLAARRTKFHITSAWWRSDLALLTLADSPIDALDQLAGKRITAGVLFQAVAQEKLPGAIIVPAPASSVGTATICNGSADAVLLDRMSLDRVLLARAPECDGKPLQVFGVPEVRLDLAIISLPAFGGSADRLRGGIDGLAADGTLAAIALRYPLLSPANAEYIAASLQSHSDRRLLRIVVLSAIVFITLAVWVIDRLRTTIVARERAQTELAGSEQRFRTLADAVPDVVWTTDANGIAGYVNSRWYAYTGQEEDAARDWKWSSAIHPEDWPRCRDAWMECVKTGQLYSVEYRIRRSDGVYRWYLGRAQPVRDGSGTIVKWFGTCTDIHDQKETETELRRANAELEQFAYAASHDLSEPLRNMAVYCELLDRKYGPTLDESAREYARFIHAAAIRMRTLLDDILIYTRLARLPAAKAAEVDPNTIFRHVCSNFSNEIARSKALITCDRLPFVRMHRAHLLQMFQNLISNAMRYRTSAPPHIHVSAEQRGTDWLFSVRDNGIGIDPAYHDVIFGLFRRLHGQDTPGTGMGLAICKRVIESYGGRIWVESEPGRGATFFFVVPGAAGAGNGVQEQARGAHA